MGSGFVDIFLFMMYLPLKFLSVTDSGAAIVDKVEIEMR